MNSHQQTACREYNQLTRRGFLVGAGAATLAAMAVPAWLPRVTFARSSCAAAQDVIVQIYLRGGMDGLSAVVPWNEPSYRSARPTLRIDGPGGGSNNVLDLPGGNSVASPTAQGGQAVFGFHPALAPLLGAYRDGKLAVVHAAGLTNTNKSHFDAQKFMEVGVASSPGTVTGWLGRHIATVDPMVADSALRAVAVADGLQRTLVGADRALPVPDLGYPTGSPPNLDNFTGFGLRGTPGTRSQRSQALRDMYTMAQNRLTASAINTLNTITLLNQIGGRRYQHSIPAGNNPGDYPVTPLGNALKSAAALIDAQVGVEAIAADVIGWDTHADQGLASAGGVVTDPGANMYRLLDTVAKAVSAFYADIVVGKGRNVVIVILSEFGRRLGQNGAFGTDHGYGSAMLVLGSSVIGGRVVTVWPGISSEQPATNQDLGVTIDYRDVLGEIIDKRLGNSANLPAIFPGFTYTDRHIIN